MYYVSPPSYETIKSELLKCRDLFNLADTLQWYVGRLSSSTDNSTFVRLYQEIENSGSDVGRPYYIYRGNRALMQFLLINWTLRDTSERNAENWFHIAAMINNNYTEREGVKIAVKDVHVIMKHLDERYEYFSKFLADRPLKILLLNNSHAEFKASVHYKKDGTDLVAQYYMGGEGYYPECSLLHELGHVIHNRLTGEFMKPPASFTFMNEWVFKRKGNVTNEEWCDCFAEGFAEMAIRGLPYRPNTYYRNRDLLMPYIMIYYHVLLSTVNKNDRGALTWNKLLEIYARDKKSI